MMYLRWEDGRPLADRETIAALYEVSPRTVRRHCRPVGHEPRTGRVRGVGGLALYDAFAAAEQLAEVAPRPSRTVAALRERYTQLQASL
jgi:hypothetical protein